MKFNRAKGRKRLGCLMSTTTATLHVLDLCQFFNCYTSIIAHCYITKYYVKDTVPCIVCLYGYAYRYLIVIMHGSFHKVITNEINTPPPFLERVCLLRQQKRLNHSLKPIEGQQDLRAGMRGDQRV